jgi:hypothetical protein
VPTHAKSFVLTMRGSAETVVVALVRHALGHQKHRWRTTIVKASRCQQKPQRCRCMTTGAEPAQKSAGVISIVLVSFFDNQSIVLTNLPRIFTESPVSIDPTKCTQLRPCMTSINGVDDCHACHRRDSGRHQRVHDDDCGAPWMPRPPR